MGSVIIETAIGRIRLDEEDGAITACRWAGAGETAQGDHPVLEAAARQLEEYLAGRRSTFDLPLEPRGGTPFQRRVWEALRRIPYGATRSYGELAAEVGSPRAARAVGSANARNPISIFIPCHRVIQSSGQSGGYGGGPAVKRRLLALEAAHAPRG